MPSSDICISSVAQSCLTLCNPMDCSMSGFPVHHQHPELAQTHVHPVSDAIHLIFCPPLLLHLQSFPASGTFQMSQFFTSGGQSIVIPASASVLPMNIPILKLKLQYFGHLMRRTDSLEETLMLGKIEGGGEGDDRG